MFWLLFAITRGLIGWSYRIVLYLLVSNKWVKKRGMSLSIAGTNKRKAEKVVTPLLNIKR